MPLPDWQIRTAPGIRVAVLSDIHGNLSGLAGGAGRRRGSSVYSSGGALYHQAGVPASEIPLGGGQIVVHS
jgi:hypothetical protein